MTVPSVTLNDGNQIPQLGYGVFRVPPADCTTRRSRTCGVWRSLAVFCDRFASLGRVDQEVPLLGG